MSMPPDPSHILDTGFAFWRSKVLLTAVELGLFTVLGNRAMTAAELGEALHLDRRGTYDFFDALVSLGFLERAGDGEAGRYRNTAETGHFLDKNSSEYVGGILEMLSARLFRFWGDLRQGLETGEPQNEIRHSQKSIFDELYGDEAKLEQFIAAMSGVSRPNFRALAEAYDFSQHSSLCDVGGSSGLLSIMVAERHPRIRCTWFDLPAVEPIARRSIERAGLADRIATASGDFFADPLPKADVVTMGMILHDWDLAKKMHLIRAAYDALPKGGVFIVVENLIDDARRENSHGLLMSLNMLIEFGDAFDFTGADFRGWCEEAGFERVEILSLGGPCSAGVAYK